MRPIIAVIALALLAACSDPRSTPLPHDLSQLESIKPAMDKLSEEERQLVVAYITRHTMASMLGGLFGAKKNDPIPPDTTIGKAIEAQRAFQTERAAAEAKQKAKEAAAKAEADALLASLRSAISTELFHKEIIVERGRSGAELNKHATAGFWFTNHTEKPIAAFKGVIEIEDLLGDKVTGLQVSSSETIDPGKKSIWVWSRSLIFGFNTDEYQKFGNMDESKFRVIWKPQAIVFSDGSKLGK